MAEQEQLNGILLDSSDWLLGLAGFGPGPTGPSSPLVKGPAGKAIAAALLGIGGGPDLEKDFITALPEAEASATGIRQRYSIDPRVTEVSPFGLDALLSLDEPQINLPG